MRVVWATAFVVIVALLMSLLPAFQAGAQDKPKIELVPQIGHSNTVTAAAFSPDGLQVVSGGWDKTLKLWDAASGRLLHTFEGHLEKVNAVAFSPDGLVNISNSGWEWTSSRYMRYPYNPTDGREDKKIRKSDPRVIRGGNSNVETCLGYTALRGYGS